jgi:integrase
MKLDTANAKLKAGGVHLQLEDRGGWISIRGMLPCRNGEGKKQQRLPLRIGATPGGIDRAFAKALEIRAAIDCDRFDWGDYCQDDSPNEDTDSFAYWIEAMGRDYLARGGKRETWEREYMAKCFSKIPDGAFDPALLRGIVLGVSSNSRTRSRLVSAFGQLLEFAGRENTLREYRGSYRAIRPINPRALPPDDLLLSFWARLGDDPWGTVAGLMIVYGLRNYECFRCDLTDYPTLQVDRGKTDRERFVFPLLPQWAERIDPGLPLPDCSGDNQALGNRVTHAFKRLGFPLAPYNIRHCWARRAFEQGIDTDLAAALMGHSEDVHRKIYQRWIEKKSYADRFYGSLNKDKG